MDGDVSPCVCWQASPIGNISNETLDEMFERYELYDNSLKKIYGKGGFHRLDDNVISELCMTKEEYDDLLKEFEGNGCAACVGYFKRHG